MRHLVMPLLATAVSVLITAPAHADLGDQLLKLLADDGAAFDHFGISVAISGATVIVGADGGDDNGANSGSAYLFDTTTGRQLFKLLPNDGEAVDVFGFSVAIGGATVIVGATHDDDNGSNSGSAYLFDTTTGQQLFKLLPDDGAANDRFGHSVAISGATAIVGADYDDDNGTNSGSAYLFDTTTGAQIAKLLPNDGARLHYFGNRVAISGATAIVGEVWDDENGFQSGSAYLFDTTTGRQIAKFLPDDGAAGDNFGWSVAISGTTAVVGSPLDDDNGAESGSGYLFDISDPQNPLQIAKLLANDGAPEDYFGLSVAISGTTAILGAFLDDDNGDWTGSAYLFDTTTGRQIAKLLANDGAAGDRFGVSVGISGATGKEAAIVGAYWDDDNGTNSGSAYLFDASSCPWDLDGSGSVGASDLLSLLVSWGPCKGCPADFDGDGSVGASDLLALLVNWGPCP
jgi:hypothetical protein